MRRVKKKTTPVALIIVILALAAAAAGVFSFARPDAGLVVSKVFDGDSVLLSDGREIRYIGIDAPETGGNRPAEYGGEAAADLNERLVGNNTVRLESDVEAKDRYGRTLAYVYVGDTMVNRELVLAGVALASPYPPNLKHQNEFSTAMEEARLGKRGLWADPDRWMVRTDDAGKYLGQSKTVVGRVLSTGAAGAGVFLNFGPDYTPDFTAFIPRKDLWYFQREGIADPADYYRGKTVEVTGTIHEKNGPSITVEHPGQIYVLGARTAPDE